MKLNLGCGNDIREGYINIDPYTNLKSVDMCADVLDLPFKDNTIDEIYISHVMEHMGIYNIPIVLLEFNRVLKERGLLIIRVPDLKDRLTEFLKSEHPGTRIHTLDNIFGGQTHEGDFHKNGFDEEMLKLQLSRYMFETVNSEYRKWRWGNEIKSISKKTGNIPIKTKIILTDAGSTPKILIRGPQLLDFDIRFYSNDNGSLRHRKLFTNHNWTSPHPHDCDWLVQVYAGRKLLFEKLVNDDVRKELESVKELITDINIE